MSAEELYEATRGVWTVGVRREQARYALAVFQGVVREAYEILAWHRAGTLWYRTRQRKDVDDPDRWEFSGKVSEELAAKYRSGSVEHYFPRGAQLPFTYVNC